jgi:hypothetical protein
MNEFSQKVTSYPCLPAGFDMCFAADQPMSDLTHLDLASTAPLPFDAIPNNLNKLFVIPVVILIT